MKHTWCLLLPTFFLSSTLIAQSSFVETQKTVLLERDMLGYGYTPPSGTLSISTKQPFSTREEIDNFLLEVNRQKSSEIPAPIQSWITQNATTYDENTALIFVRHPLKLTKLFDTSFSKIADEYNIVCEKNENAKELIKKYNTLLNAVQTKLEENQTKIADTEGRLTALSAAKKAARKAKQDSIKALQKVNEGYLTQLIGWRQLVDSYSKDTLNFTTRLTALQKDYKEARNRFVEDTSTTVITLLSKDNYEWSDYLLNKKNIMVVFVGGAETFKNYELQITNNKKQYQTELTDLISIAKAVTGGFPLELKEAASGCRPSGDEATVPLTYVLLKRSKIDPPSTIEFVKNNQKVKQLAEMHEKSWIGIKVGVSVADIDRKNFVVSPDYKLNINTDSLKADELKLHAMALLEIYPFGRDYDRLKPFWESDNIPVYQRLGIVGGLKISKDPLETLFLGGSFAATKAFNFTMGIAFNKVAKDVDSLIVGPNATLDYLRRNTDKEYKPTLYVGISLTPSALLKVFGVKND